MRYKQRDTSKRGAYTFRAQRSELRAHCTMFSAACPTVDLALAFPAADAVFDQELELQKAFRHIFFQRGSKSRFRRVRTTPGSPGERVRAKIDSVISHNPNFDDPDGIASVLRGRPNSGADPMFSPSELANFEYAPITSVDIERTFSTLKHVLNDRRLNFSFENLKQILVVNCNQ